MNRAEMAVAFGAGVAFASGRLLGATGPGMESYNWKAKPISPCLGAHSAPKNYFVWGCFPKIEWAPAYVGSRPAVDGDFEQIASTVSPMFHLGRLDKDVRPNPTHQLLLGKASQRQRGRHSNGKEVVTQQGAITRSLILPS
jgi:hypothetical protein